MGHRNLKGIEGFFADFEKADRPPNTTPVTVDQPTLPKPARKPEEATAPAEQPPDTPLKRRSAPKPAQRPRLPYGRPPGKKNGEGTLKAKTSLWIDADLMDAYRERTYEERCLLGELIERAMREYRARNW